jgi:arabinofuranan 3-O-arabinosyltransferase
MLSAFLVSRPSYDHYLLVPLPLLLAGLPYAASVTRTVWFWMALVPQLPGVTWPYLEAGERRAFRDAVTLCALAVTVGLHSWRRAGLEAAPAVPVPPSRGAAAPSSASGV